MTDREYGYWINNIPGIGLTYIGRLLNSFKNAKEVFFAREEELRKIEGLREKNILDIINSKNTDKIKKNLEVLENKGIKFVLRNDENYPKKLAEIYNPPWILYYRGRLPIENRPTIAIIGARNCTEYGSIVAKKLAYELSVCGFQIISGMARGIDTYAHKGALEVSEGTTFGIMGCGIDMCYPKENISIYMNTINRGGIISEYPMYTGAIAGNFPMRNRIISGLADAIVVVEAKKKSGSLITVDYALEQGKEVYVIPGRLDDPLSEGCNNLIKMGAKVVTSKEDIIEDFIVRYKDIFSDLYNKHTEQNIDASNYNKKKNIDINSGKNPSNLQKKYDGHLCKNNEDYKNVLASDEKIVYACLRLEPKHIDEIICETQLGIGEVIRILFSLEEKGVIIQSRNNYYSRLK